MKGMEARATLYVRTLGFVFLCLGIYVLVANLVESLPEFNPAYIGFFLLSEVLWPGLALLMGLLLLSFSGKFGKRLARGLED